MVRSGIDQDGGCDSVLGDGGGADGWGEHLTSGTTQGHDAQSPVTPPRGEYGRDPAARHREAEGRATSMHFAITEWTPSPHRRPRRGMTGVMVLVGEVAVTVVVVVLGRDGRAPGRDTTVPPAPASGSGAAATALPPRSAGTPRTELLAPTAPPPTFEQMTPTPVVSPRGPRREAPTQHKPSLPPVSPPPSMSFAPKPVTPPATATPGRNGHHGFF